MNAEQGDARIEALLQGAATASPSPFLDQRMEALFRRRGRALRVWTHAGSFAAGLLVAAILLVPRINKERVVTIEPAGQAGGVPAAPAERISEYYVAQARQSVQDLPGVVDGMPVRLHRVRNEYMLFPAGEERGAPAGQLILPATYTLTTDTPN